MHVYIIDFFSKEVQLVKDKFDHNRTPWVTPHDDVMVWTPGMITPSAFLSLYESKPLVYSDKGPVMRSFAFLVNQNKLLNSPVTVDLRRLALRWRHSNDYQSWLDV